MSRSTTILNAPRPSKRPKGACYIMNVPDELILALYLFLSPTDANSLGKTCKRFSNILHHELRNDDIASGAYRSAIWALYEFSDTATLERAIVVHRADPNKHLYRTGRAMKLVCASLLGHAAWSGRHEQLLCLLENGADPSKPAGAVYVVPKPEFGQVPIHLALLGNRHGRPYRCPAQTILSLLDHGADGSDLLQRTADLYQCAIHQHTCATPIILRLAQAYLHDHVEPVDVPEDPDREFTSDNEADADVLAGDHAATPQIPVPNIDYHHPDDIDSAFDFILHKMGDPVPALITLVNMTPPNRTLFRHPLTKCVRAMIREHETPPTPTITTTPVLTTDTTRTPPTPTPRPRQNRTQGLLDCLNFLLSRAATDPATQDAISLSYGLVSGWWTADRGPTPPTTSTSVPVSVSAAPAEDGMRHRVFERLLQSGVHPDHVVAEMHARPLWCEVELAVGQAQQHQVWGMEPDLRVVELLLKYGADPLRRGGGREGTGGRCPLDFAKERSAGRVVEVLERYARRSPPRPSWWKGLR